MLLVERIIHHVSPGSHSHMPLPTVPPNPEPSMSTSRVEFDVELGDLEREEGIANGSAPNNPPARHEEGVAVKAHAYPLTLGLIVHALADGFALGASATSPIDRGLSITVFLALIVHKGEHTLAHPYEPRKKVNCSHCNIAPTVLALTTSLLATGLPRPDCRKHVAVFSAATPVGAILVYFLLSFVHINNESPWTGVAMLISVSITHVQWTFFLNPVIGRNVLVCRDRAPARKERVRGARREDAAGLRRLWHLHSCASWSAGRARPLDWMIYKSFPKINPTAGQRVALAYWSPDLLALPYVLRIYIICSIEDLYCKVSAAPRERACDFEHVGGGNEWSTRRPPLSSRTGDFLPALQCFAFRTRRGSSPLEWPWIKPTLERDLVQWMTLEYRGKTCRSSMLRISFLFCSR